MVFFTHSTTVSPSTGLRPATVEGSGIAVEASSTFGWEDPVDRAISVVMHVLGHNWTAPVEESPESVFEPQENTEPHTPLRGILADGRGGCQTCILRESLSRETSIKT